MIELILFGTHLLAAILGAALMRAVTIRAAESMHQPTMKGTSVSQHSSPTTTKFRDRLRVGLILIVASVFMVSIGVSAALFQVQANRADRAFAAKQECLNTFAGDFSKAANDRSDATAKLNEAQKQRDIAELARDNALDDIIDIVTKARANPPRATEADFDRALNKFGKAKLELVMKQRIYNKAQKQLNEVRKTQPYPKAAC